MTAITSRSENTDSAFAIFKIFFSLGWVSFGGPAAHIGYFRSMFVEQRQWLSDDNYAQIVALSQFLPGPGSSQVGFAVGYQRGGIIGGIMAFLGFTLPSVLLMLLLAIASSQLMDASYFQHAIHGLKLLAVVVVADAAWGMYKNFCKNNVSATICVMTAIALLLMPSIGTQIFVLLIATLLGVKCLPGGSEQSTSSFKLSFKPIILFIILLFGLPLVAWANPIVQIFSDFFQAGSLVFGGGHVVLPLLQNIVGEQLSQDAFLTGYAAAQAVPGPMFTFATYLGYELLPQMPVVGALVATLAVFLPGFLLLVGVLNNWQALSQHSIVAGALNGVNASVVGLLIAALYQPVFVSAVFNALDVSLLILGAILMKQFKLPIVAMVIFFVGAGLLSPVLSNLI